MLQSISRTLLQRGARSVGKKPTFGLVKSQALSRPWANASRAIARVEWKNYEHIARRRYAWQYSPPVEPAEPESSINWNYLYFLMPLTCFGLGYWQMQRLEWKENLIRERTEGLKAPPLELDFSTENYDPVTFPRELTWKPVSVRGVWVHSQEILVGPRVLNGKPGFHLITPLDLEGGHRVLINRGFVPKDQAERSKRPETLTRGEVTVKGTMREISAKPSWVPENVPERGEWYWIDIPALALRTHAEPFFIDSVLDEENPKKLPIGGQLNQPLSNNHFQYMLTWFTLGAILTGLSFLLVKRGGSLPPALPPHINPKKPWWDQPNSSYKRPSSSLPPSSKLDSNPPPPKQ
jgi:surfeit locus 1 family protein